MTANATSIVQHVIQIKNGIMKHFNVSVKLIICAKLIIVGILAHVFVKMVLKYCWWFKNCVWWNHISYGCYIKECHKFSFNKFWW